MTSALVTTADLITDLGLTGTTETAFLTRAILRASEAVETYVGYSVERAERTFTTHAPFAVCSLGIPFRPVHSISRLIVDGEVWIDATADPVVEAGTGFGFNSWGTLRAPTNKVFCGDIEVTLTSGYYLADDVGPPAITRDLPLAFERAVNEIVKAELGTRERDESVKGVAIPGVASFTYETNASGELPETAMRLLDNYRIHTVA